MRTVRVLLPPPREQPAEQGRRGRSSLSAGGLLRCNSSSSKVQVQPKHTIKEAGRYLRERWALTTPAAWEQPSAEAASHRAFAACKLDHWLRRLRCAAGLLCRSDEGDEIDFVDTEVWARGRHAAQEGKDGPSACGEESVLQAIIDSTANRTYSDFSHPHR